MIFNLPILSLWKLYTQLLCGAFQNNFKPNFLRKPLRISSFNCCLSQQFGVLNFHLDTIFDALICCYMLIKTNIFYYIYFAYFHLYARTISHDIACETFNFFTFSFLRNARNNWLMIISCHYCVKSSSKNLLLVLCVNLCYVWNILQIASEHFLFRSFIRIKGTYLVRGCQTTRMPAMPGISTSDECKRWWQYLEFLSLQ